ncbi:MAG: hypothetical protein ACJ8GJ_12995 [Vitreoscilla sp.]
MIRPASSLVALLACAMALAVALPAQARNDDHRRPIAEAMAKKHAHELAGDLPLLFGSATASGSELMPGTIEAAGDASIVVDPRSRVHLTDEEACQLAFEDAVGKLADRARRAGAAAVVGIVSNFKGERVDDARFYDCHSGSSKSYVTLEANLASKYVPPTTRVVPPATGFAPLEDARAVPISDAGRERYAHFLTLPKPRAFVIFEDGSWRFYSKDPEAMTKALDYCAREGRRCWLYAADDRVVWSADITKRIGASSQLEGGPRPAAAAGDDHQ